VPSLLALLERLDPCLDITNAIQETLVDNPPISIHEGGLIRPASVMKLTVLEMPAKTAKHGLPPLNNRSENAPALNRSKWASTKSLGTTLRLHAQFGASAREL